MIGSDPAIESKLNMSLAELKLSVRATNCLESENIHTVRDLVRRTEDQLLEVRNFGETTLNEVQEKLTELGLRLGMRFPPRPECSQPVGKRDFHRLRKLNPKEPFGRPRGLAPNPRDPIAMRHRRKGRMLGRSPAISGPC